MSYKINKTDGSLLVDLIDGRVDRDTTDLVLVGRNFTGYGEIWNENFVKLLENFKSTTPPPNPLVGQLWFDSGEGRLKIFTGTQFKSTDTTIVSVTEPQLVAGDIWIDSAKKQIYFSDGQDKILAGPIYSSDQGVTGYEVKTLVDTFGITRTIALLMIGNSSVAIVSKENFIAANISQNLQILNGFSTTIKAGFNINSNFGNFAFNGRADSALSLIDINDNVFTTDDFLKVSVNNTSNGTLHIKNDSGLIVGINSDFAIRVEGNSVVLRNRLNNSDMKLQVRQGFFNVDAITVKGTDSRIGIWKVNPQYTLDVAGDLRISGNLIVEGDTVSLDVTDLQVEDKVIELSRTSSGIYLTDPQLDGAGIIVKGQSSDKTIIWNNSFNSWGVNTNFNIPAGFSYQINNSTILSATQLSSTVTEALGLTEIGTLEYINVDNINLNNSTITTTQPLIISSSADIAITDNRKITGVGKPTEIDTGDTVATKEYVDERYQFEDVRIHLDITGLTDTQIALILEDLYPSDGKNVGINAFVHGINYSGSSLTYNASDGVVKTFVAVDRNGVENQSVVQDFSFNDVTDTVTLTAIRSFKRFRVVSPTPGVKQWTFDINLNSSV